MPSPSRRDFLKTASLAAGAAASSRIRAWGAGMPSPGPVQVWGTFRDRRHAASPSLAWKPATTVAMGYFTDIKERVFCTACAHKHGEEGGMLPLINSPRVGVL